MIFTKEKVNYLLKLNDGGDNDCNENFNGIISLPLILLEAKVLTDRWDQCANHIIIHTSHSESLKEKLKSKAKDYDDKRKYLWGIKIHLSDYIDINKGLMLVLDDGGNLVHKKFPSRSVAVFPM